MSKILFIGGISSGKSELAENLALSYKEPRLYIATSDIKDEETLKRIEKHKKRRKNLFDTQEEPLYPEKFFDNKYNIILLDCLTHFYNNIFYYITDIRKREKRIKDFFKKLDNYTGSIILVSNEVGLGGVPANKLAREFADFSGWANSLIAKSCDEAYLVVSGMNIRLK